MVLLNRLLLSKISLLLLIGGDVRLICYLFCVYMVCRCAPIPSDRLFCRATFQYTHFSSAVFTQLSRIVENIGAMIDSTEIQEGCKLFLAFYKCTADYAPCNATSKKIL